MYYINLFFAVFGGLIALANLGVIVYYGRKFPTVLLINGAAAIFCGAAAYFNFLQL